MDELEAIEYDVDEMNWGKYAVMGTPLLDFFSVSIKPKITLLDDTQKPLEIYGTIEVINGQSNRFKLFDQPFDSPQKISNFDSNDSLFLYLPDDGPFYSFFPLVKLEVSLLDRVRNIDLVKRKLVLVNYKHFCNYDIIQFEDVEGDMASLCFKYITYRAAVWAVIEFIPISKTGGSDFGENGQVTVSGTIFASCLYDGNDFSAHSHSERGCSCVLLLEFSNENKSVEVSLGEPVELCRSILAVPSYANLVIETNLKATDGEVVRNVASFSVRDGGIDDKNVKGPNGLVCKVQVTWCHESDTHMECEGVEDASIHEDESSDMEQEKKAKVSETQASQTCLYDEPLPLKFRGEDLTEIFSIFIGLDKGKACHIHGKIVVLDTYNIYTIYDKDQSQSEKFECSKTLSLLDLPKCLAGSLMTFITDLKDNDHELNKGFFCWNDFTRAKPFLNSRICSVIKGKLGYAAVHHAIFSSAIQASVKVYLSPTFPCDHICISGTLMGEYGDHEYSSFLESEYYRSVLFTRSDRNNSLMLPFKGHESAVPISSSSHVSSDEKGISMPLSKSVVCVPTNSSLRIEVNLSLMSESPRVEDQALSGSVEFQIGRNTCWMIQSQAYRLCMLVEWNQVHFPLLKKKSC